MLYRFCQVMVVVLPAALLASLVDMTYKSPLVGAEAFMPHPRCAHHGPHDLVLVYT
jgi:hypothetical protein